MHHSHERGFSLVEMLATIAIMMIIMGTLFANFRSYGGTATLEKDANELGSLVRTAMQNSTNAVSFNGTYPSYGVYFTTEAPPDGATSQAFMYAYDFEDTLTVGNLTKQDTYMFNDESMSVTEMRFTPEVEVTKIEFAPRNNSATKELDNVSVLFLRPDPLVFITTKNAGGNQDLLGVGTLTVTIQMDDDERRITINSSGNVRVGY